MLMDASERSTHNWARSAVSNFESVVLAATLIVAHKRGGNRESSGSRGCRWLKKAVARSKCSATGRRHGVAVGSSGAAGHAEEVPKDLRLQWPLGAARALGYKQRGAPWPRRRASDSLAFIRSCSSPSTARGTIPTEVRVGMAGHSFVAAGADASQEIAIRRSSRFLLESHNANIRLEIWNTVSFVARDVDSSHRNPCAARGVSLSLCDESV
jgi:hypothetical protein